MNMDQKLCGKYYNTGVTIGFNQTEYSISIVEKSTGIEVCVAILEGNIAADLSVNVTLQPIQGTATGTHMYGR